MTYGCYNRKPLATHVVVQDGWMLNTVEHWLQANYTTRHPVLEAIPDPMSKDCRYSVDTVDPRCAGCAHNNSEGKS